MKKLANMCDGCIYSSEYVPTGCLISELAYYTMNEKCECTQKEVKEMEKEIYNKNLQEEGENHDVCCEHGLDDRVTENVSLFDKIKIRNLFDTAGLMGSADYKVRFVAEYYQTKIRYEKLKAFNNKIEAARMNLDTYPPLTANRNVDMPEHDCPDHLLLSQQHIMGEYLHILEVRAVIEGIDLDAYK